MIVSSGNAYILCVALPEGESKARPAPARSVPELLRHAFMDNLSTSDDLADLQFYAGLTDQQAAKALNVSLRTFRRWKTSQKPNPTALKLFAILCGHAPWDGWQGWQFQNGLLFPPGYTKHGISPR